ncbi:glycosyltransferase family protein [Enterovibrio calviensis]|uniref:hypothetical protein n=1 Tax=Enterovibrio calviensis TaxID=91359 RepID=UPI000487D45F|nr:hypothetical protein [Enterovibrio calviensis]
MKRKISILSDISYSDYQHVNQMLYRNIHDNNNDEVEVFFLQRFLMNTLKIKYIKKIILKFIFLVRKSINSKVRKNAKSDHDPIRKKYKNIINVINIPSKSCFFDFVNLIIISLQSKKVPKKGTVITFLPSKALSLMLGRFDDIVYYCVHDSHMQSYHKRNSDYEIDLVNKSRLVFCDNETVLHRLADGEEIYNIFDSEIKKGKFYLVPPPVPKEFYKIISVENEFDFIYYGSIHQDIDVDLIRNLSLKYSVLIVSFQRFNFSEHENITFISATPNLELLSNYISRSKAILFPYTNSFFMNTVSPAKLYQSMATKKPIYCSNLKLTEEFQLEPISIGIIRDLNMSEIISKEYMDVNRYDERVILDLVSQLIVCETKDK